MILHQVLTTEKVPFTYRVAGLGSRYLAFLVDTLFIATLYLIWARTPVPSRRGATARSSRRVWP